MLSATLVLVFFMIVVRELRLHFWLHGSTLIRSRRKGAVRIELRRRVTMERLPQHVSQFPAPREERILVGRLCGCVLWHREESVALPEAACTHLGEITPQEFDRQFPAWLRVMGKAS
jgi:hypothetical protein